MISLSALDLLKISRPCACSSSACFVWRTSALTRITGRRLNTTLTKPTRLQALKSAAKLTSLSSACVIRVSPQVMQLCKTDRRFSAHFTRLDSEEDRRMLPTAGVASAAWPAAVSIWRTGQTRKTKMKLSMAEKLMGREEDSMLRTTKNIDSQCSSRSFTHSKYIKLL